MTDINSIKDLELNSLTPFQKELHEPGEFDEAIMTEHTDVFPVKTSWKSSIYRELDVSTKHKKVVYHLEMESFDAAEKVIMMFQLPKLAVKKQFEGKIQMCWPKNLLHILYETGDLCFDSDPRQTHTPESNTVFRNYFLERKRKHHLKTIGNRDHLTEWTDSLSADRINCKQQYYFSEHKCKSIPIFMCRKSKITFEYMFRLHLKDILRVREFKNDVWVEIPFNSKYFLGVPTGSVLEQPKMRAKYTHLTDPEKNQRISESNGGIFYYDDFIYIPPGNPVSLDSVDILKLQANDPCKAIFILPENIECSKNRDYCVYTDEGFSVIKSVQLLYQNKYYKLMTSDNRFLEDILAEEFPACPYEKGTGGIPLTSKFKTVSADVGITFSSDMNASLIINIQNTDPKLNGSEVIENTEEDDREKEVDNEEVEIKNDKKKKKFLIHYLLMVTKKLEFDGEKCKKASEK